MNGFIYLAENKVSGQKYVGLTQYSIELRWEEHVREARRKNLQGRPLHAAINKYGASSFKLSELEECEIEKLPEREIYWIEKYETYRNGYNATLGGEGRKSIDKELVVAEYFKCYRPCEVAWRTGCCIDTVKKILGSELVDRDVELERDLQCGCQISARSESGEMSFFQSQMKAAEWIKNQRAGDDRPIRRIASVLGKYSRKKIGKNIIYGYEWRTISADEYLSHIWCYDL